MKYLIISDLHIGDGTGTDDFGDNDRKMVDFVLKYAFKVDKIILNGDIFELWQCSMRKIRKAHRQLCWYLENSTQIIRVKGNHDYKLFKRIKHIITTKSGKKVLITHGFQHDKWMTNPLFRFFTWCIGIVEKVFPNVDNVFFKPDKIEADVRRYAIDQMEKYHIVILGHTHKKRMERIEGVREGWYDSVYANSGACINGRLEGVLLDTDTDKVELIKEL